MQARKNVILNEQTHVYTVDGKRANMSLTKMISKFHEPFDPETVLDKIGITDPVVRAEKKREWAVSAPEGTFTHTILEEFVKGTDVEQGIRDAGYIEMPAQAAAGIRALEALQTRLKPEEGWKYHPEHRSFLETLSGAVVAGTMDLVLVNDSRKEVIIVDYKTSRSLTRDAYGKKFFEPIPKTPDSKFHKYSLQLEGYGEMVKLDLPGYTITKKFLLQLKPDGTIVWHKGQDMSKQFELLRQAL